MAREAFVALLAVLLVPSLAARVVAAGPSQKDLDNARAAFRAALAAEKEGDYQDALMKFRAAAEIKPTPQIQFHVAVCEEKLGKWKAALVDYEAAKVGADAKKVAEVSKAAPKLAESLRARMPSISVVSAVGTSAAHVSLDGETIGPDRMGAEIVVDPGLHVVLASNDGAKEVRFEVTVGAKEKKVVALALEPSPAVPPRVESPPAPCPVPAPSTPALASDAPRAANPQANVGLAVGVFGVVALAASGAFYGARLVELHRANGCGGADCASSASSARDEAHTFTTLGEVAFGVGVASVGLGAILYFTAKDEPPPKTAIVPYAAGALVGVGWRGEF